MITVVYLFLFIRYKLDSQTHRSRVCGKKPKPHRLKPKQQDLPQKKPQYAFLHLQKPQFAVEISVLA